MKRSKRADIHQIETALQAPLCLVRRRGLKRLGLLINRRGQVQLTVPWQHSDEFALQFAIENLDWLRQQLEKFRTRPSHRLPILKVDGQVPFLGQEFRLRWIPFQGRARAEFAERELQIFCSEPDAELWKKLIRRQYEAQARWLITERVAHWAGRMQETYGRVSFRAQRTRWGSCTLSGNLSFNWKLMFAPPEVIDYVVIHELAHRAHLDHSAKFWSRVAEFDPNYDEHRKYLQKHQECVRFLDGFELHASEEPGTAQLKSPWPESMSEEVDELC
jgi:predicted metal-dependent hydrolase